MTPSAGAGRPAVRYRSGADLVKRLADPEPLLAVELRPPRRDAAAGRDMDRWIDLHHALRRLLAADTLVFVTDNATGASEEENLRHLRANLGPGQDLSRIVPFLTTKHPLDYCLRHPGRAAAAGHAALVVLGGDRHDGVPRCVGHACELRQMLRERWPGLAFGGWVNPHRDPAWQLDLLEAAAPWTDFALTQIVSHHDIDRVSAFLAEVERRRLAIPLLFGVFYWRSARRESLEALSRLLPVPFAGLEREFAGERLDPRAVCGRTLRALGRLGIRRIYLSNLPAGRAAGLRDELRAELLASL